MFVLLIVFHKVVSSHDNQNAFWELDIGKLNICDFNSFVNQMPWNRDTSWATKLEMLIWISNELLVVVGWLIVGDGDSISKHLPSVYKSVHLIKQIIGGQLILHNRAAARSLGQSSRIGACHSP